MLAKKIALGVGIAIVFPMLLHYGVSTFTPKPKWEDYNVPGFFDPQASAEERHQRQIEQQHKQELRRAAEKRFEQHLFAVAVPLGLVAILFGAFLRVQATGTGLMFGGIFSICDGYFNYWSELADVMKFLSLLAAFILLLFVGYKKLERKEI
jgi:hypothetical protein